MALYTHTHTSIFIQNGKTILCQEKNKLNQAYRKLSLILHVKNKIGYIKGKINKVNVYRMKTIKLLHDSLSFL